MAFRSHLADGGMFEGRFPRVVFAVYDTSAGQATFEAFREVFAVTRAA